MNISKNKREESVENTKLNFYDENGKRIDIREIDIIMGIDLVKNAENEIARETEINPKERTDALESYFRLWYFLVSIRAGLRPQGN